jgi:hypothetical protein
MQSQTHANGIHSKTRNRPITAEAQQAFMPVRAPIIFPIGMACRDEGITGRTVVNIPSFPRRPALPPAANNNELQ